ncbi:MAG: putative DNA binding domain-containing protein [Bacteroidetes bacterium]|nr:putative DNA binding domain-containing protein [Bacteroidota bacterium]
MKQEKQNIEFKQSWHDDCLKSVCGFANASGGVICIGKNDLGKTVGIRAYKKLMEDIPNKVKNAMGITAEVNLNDDAGVSYIELLIQPYSVPISLRGRYYYRSGSTNQELTGAALNEFLLKKSGKTWDDVIEPRAGIEDISEDTVKTFFKAAETAGRLPGMPEMTLLELLEKLRLIENGQLKRAAIILFGKDPGKFYPNTFVKIGRFGMSDTDLRFQETEEGNLITLLQKVLDQLNHKFLTRQVSFKGMYRLEKLEYPLPALREMLLNSMIHRNYLGAPTQIRVYDDKLSIWNEGILPEGLTFESLKGTHSSKPRNPIIADVTFKGGYIDAWGRGTIKIIESCKEYDLPEPLMAGRDGGFLLELIKNKFSSENLVKLGLNDRQVQAVSYVRGNGKISNAGYQSLNNISKATATRDLTELVEKYKLFRKFGIIGTGTFYEFNQ